MQGRASQHLGNEDLHALLLGTRTRTRVAPEWTPGDWEFGIDAWPSGHPTDPCLVNGVHVRFGAWWDAMLSPHLGPRPASPHFPVAWGASFCASREEIRRLPRTAYEGLLDQAAAGRNPEVAHFLERSWVHMMNVSSAVE